MICGNCAKEVFCFVSKNACTFIIIIILVVFVGINGLPINILAQRKCKWEEQ